MRNIVSQTVPYQYDTIYSPFKAAEFEYAMDWLPDNGFTGVELAIAYPDDVNASKLLSSIESRGLVATSIATGQAFGRDGISLSSLDPDIRKRAVEIVKGHVNLSVETGMPNITIGLIRGKIGDDDRDRVYDALINAMDVCANYSYNKGVRLQVEPINHNETDLLNTVSETIQFLAELGNPENLGILYDTYHSDIDENGCETEAIAAAGSRLFNVHFADSGRQLPGYGTIDFSRTYEAVKKTGYSGPFALESMVTPSLEFVLKHSAKSILQFIK